MQREDFELAEGLVARLERLPSPRGWRCWLYLPGRCRAGVARVELHPELRFGFRLGVGEAWLHRDWGFGAADPCPPGRVFRKQQLACLEGTAGLRAELTNLREAVQRRRALRYSVGYRYCQLAQLLGSLDE